MPALQVSKLESLIVDRICSLDYVKRAGYCDDGQEVTVMVVHDHVPGRLGEMILEISRRGSDMWDEMPGRMISPLAIHDGPDLPGDGLFGCKPIYERNHAH